MEQWSFLSRKACPITTHISTIVIIFSLDFKDCILKVLSEFFQAERAF